MSDIPKLVEAKSSDVYTVTLTISGKVSHVEIIKNMAEVAKFLTKMAVEMLRDDKGQPAMVSPANPAPNACLQSAATLEHGALQFDMMVKQQGGFVAPGNMAPSGPRRAN